MKTLLSIASVGGFTLCILSVSLVRPGEMASALNDSGLSYRVAALETKVAQVQTYLDNANATIRSLQAALARVQANKALALGPYVSVDTSTINTLKGPHVIFTGVNVHIRSGSGATYDAAGPGITPTTSEGTLMGLGNLIVGYNEVPTAIPGILPNRTGSHNLVAGSQNNFTSYGGLIVGINNAIKAPYASVSGGVNSEASGPYASICGGNSNTASGYGASVSGGQANTASGDGASVSGGNINAASGSISSVSGGIYRSATGLYNWAAGALSEPN